MLTRQLLIKISIVVLVIILGVIAWYYFNSDSNQLTFKNQPTAPNDAINNNPILDISSANEPNGENQAENSSAKTAAMNFAEKFGTLSTDSLNSQLDNLRPLVTASLALRLPELLKKNKPAAASFYVVTTRGVVAEVSSSNPEAALVMVTTQREETLTRGGESKVSYQKLRVVLTKVGGSWLVDAVGWEK